MTFDKKFVSLNSNFEIIQPDRKPQQCSYLLANDFFDRNFTLILESTITKHHDDLIASRKLILIADNNVLDIDIIGATIRVGQNLTTTLPIKFNDTIIYRDGDVLIIDSAKGFTLNCNLQFDLCWFDLSGWYFGKTAGLLGNMNNEKYDDNVLVEQSIESFTAPTLKWSMENCTQDLPQKKPDITQEIFNICDGLFRSKVSYFVNCFGVINPDPFYEMCLDLATNSYANLLNENYPAQTGVCTAALAYIESCAAERTPLRIPDTCI